MMKYPQIALTYLIAVLSTIVVLSVGIAQTQENQDVERATVKGATVKGRIAEPDDKQLQVSFDDLNVELLQPSSIAGAPATRQLGSNETGGTAKMGYRI